MDNYWSSTFGNMFLSRKGFLGAPASIDKGTECVASTNATVRFGGVFAPLVRFEALCEPPACFETQFMLEVEQHGATQFSAVHGALPVPGCAPNCSFWPPVDPTKHTPAGAPWTAPNQHVWAGVQDRLVLRPGPVKIKLRTSHELTPKGSGKRNVDLVMLTSNLTELSIRDRTARTGEDPYGLDGWLTQRGEVFLRLHNHAQGAPLNLSVPFCTGHSSYYGSHQRFPCTATGCGHPTPLLVPAQPQQTSDWMHVGDRMDTLDDGEWTLGAVVANASQTQRLSFTVEFGVLSTGTDVESIASFHRECEMPRESCQLILAFDANTRATRRIRHVEAQLADVMGYVHTAEKHLPPKGHPPRHTFVECVDCFGNSSVLSAQWNDSGKMVMLSRLVCCPSR